MNELAFGKGLVKMKLWHPKPLSPQGFLLGLDGRGKGIAEALSQANVCNSPELLFISCTRVHFYLLQADLRLGCLLYNENRELREESLSSLESYFQR